MANLHGRTGLNFSNYISNLNTIPNTYEQEPLPADDVNLDRELAMFTNTDFIDFETTAAPSSGIPMNYDAEKYAEMEQTNIDMKYEDMLQGNADSHFLDVVVHGLSF